MNQEPKTGFIVEAAWLRAIACLNVVLIHITANPLFYAPPGSIIQLEYLVVNQFTRFAVPSFVFLTGFTLAWKHICQRTPFEFAKFLKRRFLIVFIPYTFWSFFYFFYIRLLSGQLTDPTTINWGKLGSRFIHELLVGDACYHMYFIILILQFYLLAPLFLLAAQRLYHFASWLAAGVTYQLAASIINYYYISATGIPFWDLVIGRLDRNCLMWVGYFVIGIAVGGRWDSIREWVKKFGSYFSIPWLLLWVALILDFYYYIGQGRYFSGVVTSSKPLVMLYCLAFLPLISWLGSRLSYTSLNRMVLDLSDHSYGIFLAHPLVISLLQNHWPWSKYQFSLGASLLLFVLSITIPWGTISLYRNLWLRYQRLSAQREAARARSLQNSG
ncbi:MAG: acyltransferase [Syntrophomonadaceae bacterium]|nr:acyltransferase [Syntrophomonadaceae bacterium]